MMHLPLNVPWDSQQLLGLPCSSMLHFAQRVVLALVLLAPAATGLTIKNCTQQNITPGGHVAVSVNQTSVFFAVDSPYDAPAAGHVDAYNSVTKEWTTTSLHSGGRTNMCGTTWKHLAIWAGGGPHRGLPKSQVVDAYDTTTGTWTSYNMSIGRDLLACASIGDLTIFAGGSAPQVNQSETDVVDIWNHATGVWTSSTLSQSRKKPMAVVAGHKMIIAGGEIAKPPSAERLGDYTDVVDIYDSITGSWSTSKLSLARQYFGAATATPDLAVFAGGFNSAAYHRLGIVDIYNASSDTWSQAKLSVNRSNLHGANVAGRYAAFGSGNIDATSKVSFDIFDGLTGEWAPSHGHHPDLPAVASVENIALFAGQDGVVDALALNGDCSALP